MTNKKTYADAGALLAIKAPTPTEEDYDFLGNLIHVVGIGKYAERHKVIGKTQEMSELARKGILKVIVDGDTFVPIEQDVHAAVWAAACVREPELGDMQWLQVCNSLEGSIALQSLMLRCLVCSRLLSDKDAGVKNALEEAKELLESDPLDSKGSSGVSA